MEPAKVLFVLKLEVDFRQVIGLLRSPPGLVGSGSYVQFLCHANSGFSPERSEGDRKGIRIAGSGAVWAHREEIPEIRSGVRMSFENVQNQVCTIESLYCASLVDRSLRFSGGALPGPWTDFNLSGNSLRR